jgi:hypothetical protein
MFRFGLDLMFLQAKQFLQFDNNSSICSDTTMIDTDMKLRDWVRLDTREPLSKFQMEISMENLMNPIAVPENLQTTDDRCTTTSEDEHSR